MSGIPTSIAMILALLVGAYYLLEVSGMADPGGVAGPQSSGDQFVDALAAAIAHAEGYYVPLSRPNRNNNPGDISDRNIGGVVASGVDSGGLSIFDTPQDGWTALYAKIRNILNGGSTVYSPSMSISDFAQTWTGGDNASNWAYNVSAYLIKSGYPNSVDSTLTEVQMA